MKIPKGFCQCGCSSRTSRTDRRRKREGLERGEFYRFIRGHQHRTRRPGVNWHSQWWFEQQERTGS